MNLALSPTQSNVMTALRSFLISVLPGGNCIFTGSIADDILTVNNVKTGTINVGDPIVGPSILPGILIRQFLTGSGTTGTYMLSQSQTIGVQVLATGVPVIQGQVNRVAESPAADFVVMWPTGRTRLETNVDLSADAKFVGVIDGNTMVITQVVTGRLQIGSTLFGVGIANGTKVISILSGTGGIGEYLVVPPQTVSNRIISAGATTYLQPTQVNVQLDVHGPNSSDNAQIISTMFRDDYAVQQFATSGYDVVPFYADDPKQIPFVNDQQQYETRWVIDAAMQANQVVVAPQQYADSVNVTLINVDETYPPV